MRLLLSQWKPQVQWTQYCDAFFTARCSWVLHSAKYKFSHNSPSLVYRQQDETRSLPFSLASILFYRLIRLDLIHPYKANNDIITLLNPYYLPLSITSYFTHPKLSTHPHMQWAAGAIYPPEYRGRGMKLTPYLHLLLKLRMRGAILPTIHMPS
jgi:hypothetical protein